MIAAFTFSEWVLGVGFVVSTGSFIFTLWKYLVEKREKRTLADELREIQRRGRAPDLRPSALLVPKFSEATNQIVQPGACVDASTPAIGVRLTLSNLGEPVRHATDDWQEGEGLMASDIRKDLNGGAVSIGYVFDPSQLGKSRKITIHFETLDGLKLHHVYETRHGFCEFRRIDPAI